MKKIIKMVHVNDGENQVMHNGDYMFVETFPRSERIIEAFFNNGWTLVNRTQVIQPTIQKAGNYGFYKDGWDLMFEKEIEDDGIDDGDDILQQVLNELFIQVDDEYYIDDDEEEICFCDEDEEYEEYEYEYDEEFEQKNKERAAQLYEELKNDTIDIDSLDTLDLLLVNAMLKKESKE
ncbi:MAG: hypothetical protein LUG60_12785 [Erysipelotrichaceae bacterium]|nr:hypothetical protein [Erysipelotrichaceae bacterium]